MTLERNELPASQPQEPKDLVEEDGVPSGRS